MGIFSKKDSRISMVLKASFDHVRQNFDHAFSWVNYLNQKQVEQDKKLDKVDSRLENIEIYLSQIPNLNAQMRSIMDLHFTYESVLKRLNDIEGRMKSLTIQDLNMPQTQLVEIKNKLENLEKKKEDIKSNLKEKMLRTITRNSKDYIQSTLLSLIRKYERVSAYKLKEMIVEEQGLCSKSTFYRILEDIEKREDVDVVREGKEKVFFIRLSAVHPR